MGNFNFSGMTALDLSELMAIDGGNTKEGETAYDLGYKVGKAIHDFCEGFWNGLTGN